MGLFSRDSKSIKKLKKIADQVVALEDKYSAMTDEEFKELLKKRYQVQLSYYKRALMQMTKRPVKEACIYAVSIGQTIFC